MPATAEESRLLNETIYSDLESNDPVREKRAVDGLNDFTRTRIREDGVYRRVIPMQNIGNDELDRQVGTDQPVKVFDREPDSPAAVSVPFGAMPSNLYIKGDRYEVRFNRIVTPRFTKDVDELRTWHMDIRQVISDNAIKDMLAEEDGSFLSAVNSSLVAADTVVPTSGVEQWKTISGGITRDTLWDAFKIMPNTPSNIETHTCLVNHITINDIAKFGRDEMGGDMAQDIMRNGWTASEFMGKKWIVTIKKGLVPTNRLYMFGDPRFIGKSLSLVDATLHVKREAYFIEFFAYETIGGTIGWTSGLAAADFAA